jgi:hypothetical protein
VVDVLNTGLRGLDMLVGVLVMVVQSDDSSGFSPLSTWKRFALSLSPQAGLLILAGSLCRLR